MVKQLVKVNIIFLLLLILISLISFLHNYLEVINVRQYSNWEVSITEQDKPPYRILINLEENKLHLNRGDVLVKSYDVSGGKISTPTPLGTWKIISKDTWYKGFGGRWMALNVPYGKYGIHGTVFPSLIGKNASGGCIRMYNKDAKELYNIVPLGTQVTIIHPNRTYRRIKDGDVGSDVMEVQNKLKELKYFHGYPDGKYGIWLKKAVIKFQKDKGLWPTGEVNKKTYETLGIQIQKYRDW